MSFHSITKLPILLFNRMLQSIVGLCSMIVLPFADTFVFTPRGFQEIMGNVVDVLYYWRNVTDLSAAIRQWIVYGHPY
jgi:hypothetical protein